MKLVILLLLVCQGIVRATLTLGAIEEAEIEYWRYTSNDEVSRWRVKAAKEEVRAFGKLLEYAVSATDAEITLFVSRYQGTVKTENGEFAIALGHEKSGRQSYRISLYPKGEPKGRKTMHFLLFKEDGRAFSRALERFFEGKTQRKPDRVETVR